MQTSASPHDKNHLLVSAGVVSLVVVLIAAYAITLRSNRGSIPALPASPQPSESNMVASLLWENEWHVRLSACRMLGERGEISPALLAAVLPRVSDEDERVREATFTLLNRHHAVEGMADAAGKPIATRERVALQWLVERAKDGFWQQVSLCELYARPYWTIIGEQLRDRCLTCHAGRQQFTVATIACQTCHREVYDEWSRSSHAQSRSHVLLRTSESSGATAEPLASGDLRGITCVQCHVPLTSATRVAASVAASQPAACAFEFEAASAGTDACFTCHADVAVQWETWRTSRHARRAAWPPGDLEWVDASAETSCTDCHLPSRPRSVSRSGRYHHISARREPELLKSGLHVLVATGAASGHQRAATLVLTNLAGHDYPAGTCRRALRLYVWTEDDREAQLVRTLVRSCPHETVQPDFGPLAPGEAREIRIQIPETAVTVHFLITYVRDRYSSRHADVEVLRGEARVHPPPLHRREPRTGAAINH